MWYNLNCNQVVFYNFKDYLSLHTHGFVIVLMIFIGQWHSNCVILLDKIFSLTVRLQPQH